MDGKWQESKMQATGPSAGSHYGRSLIVAAGLLLGIAVVGVAEEPPGRQALEDEILQGLAKGRDVRLLLEQLAEIAPPSGPRGRPGSGQVTAELAESLATLQRVLPAAGDAAPSGKQLEQVVAAGERVRAEDLLMRAHFGTIRERLEEVGVGGEIFDRLAAAETSYGDAMDELLGAAEGPLGEIRELKSGPQGTLPPGAGKAVHGELTALGERLAAALATPPPPILRGGVLPYRQAGLAPRAPRSEPAVVPSYLNPLAEDSTGADLAATPEAPLDDDILAFAASLGHDYVRIYEHVRNEIATDWYAGSMKGAVGTLRDGSGNDVDQASLLIALFRASQLAARYVHGVVELPVEAVADDLGLNDPAEVPAALARAGVASTPVIRGGRVAAVEVEHTWVVAYVPYGNYRGAVVDYSGRTWLPLAPALASYDWLPSRGILREMDFQVDAVLASYLAAPQPIELLSHLRSEVEAYLTQNAPGESYDEQLGERTVVRQELGLLPSSLPMAVTAITGEAPALADEMVVTARFVVRAGVEETSEVVLDGTVALAELAGRRVTLSYIPATVDDHRTVNAFGGLSGVPLYLVRVRPQLKINGRPQVVGTGSLELGVAHRLEVELRGPFGSERLAQTVISGSYHALGFGAQGMPRQVPGEDDPGDTERLAARLLSQIALSLNEQWSAAEDELGGLLDVAVLRPLPSLVMVSNAVGVDYALDLPSQLRWTGVTMDAALRVAEPVAHGEDPAAARDWMRLSALQGSILEHRIFESQFLVESISADKGLGLAREQGLEVLVLDQGEGDPRLAELNHPPAVEEDVANWLRLGMVVEVPVEPITLNAWTGSVWRVGEPAIGAGGYLIAGSLAGGATTELPGSWPDFLQDELEGPYSPPANTDSLTGVGLVKVGSADGWSGEVGKIVPVPLAVKVVDEYGWPVKGAEVTFVSLRGGGSVVDEQGHDHPTLTTTTNSLGIARARFRLGKYTWVEPFYRRQSGEEFSTQVLMHLVEATALSARGLLVVDEPFQLFGTPGAPVALRRTDGDQTEFQHCRAGTWVDTITVAAEDGFGNPVSNVPVHFAVGEPSRYEGCANPPGEILNAELFAAGVDELGNLLDCPYNEPTVGQCGSPSLDRWTSPFGTSAGVILGNDVVSSYSVDVSSGILPPLHFTYHTTFGQYPSDLCYPAWQKVRLQSHSTLSHEGRNYNAARAGERFRLPIRVSLAYWLPDLVTWWNPETGEERPVDGTTGQWVPTTGEMEFLVSGGGYATTPYLVDEGIYESLVRTGVTPGLNQVRARASEVLYSTWWKDPETGEIIQWERTWPEPVEIEVTDVWGVDPQLLRVSPDPLRLNHQGQTAEEARIDYRIEPPDYLARQAELDVDVYGTVQATAIGTTRGGEGEVLIPRSFAFDVEDRYEAQLILNRGTPAEVRSDKLEIPPWQRILRRVGSSDPYRGGSTSGGEVGEGPGVFVSQEVDAVNNTYCSTGTDFIFELSREARVTLTFKHVDGLDDDGSPELGLETVLIDDQLYGPGEHHQVITPADLPAGDYRYELRVVSPLDGQEEVVEGPAISAYQLRSSLSVGHVMVKGVDLFDGHLVVQREDLSYPGRGAALRFARTYTSNNAGEASLMGTGWSHSYMVKLVVTPCGEVILIGGDGSGQRFIDVGEDELRPMKGYHGSLIANRDERTFDFYSKNGNRHHFRYARDNEWYLHFIEDPNGNRTDLIYVDDPENPRVEVVRDPAGRTLRFEYENREFAFWQGPVLTRVSGPGGVETTFEYDAWGNLKRAAREALRAETYAYRTPLAGEEVKGRHLLTSATDEITGASTRYAYQHGIIGVQGEITVESDFVSRVVEPEDGETAFSYDLAALSSRGPPELATLVTDRRGFDTRYTLNQYGSPLRIVDAEQNVTAMEWATDDVVMTARVDANGVRTDYTYDEYANLLTESVTVTHVDGEEVTYVAQNTYHSREDFIPAYVKDRIAERTDRNGHPTFFEYDDRGNLIAERIEVDHVGDGTLETLYVRHTYNHAGDRLSTEDRRGNTTFFRYDAYGNVSEVTDAVGGITTAGWNVRSLPIRQTDALGRETVFEYDTLGRVIRRVLPEVDGEGPVDERIIYEDANLRRTDVDGEGRQTVTEYDLEGRVVKVTNAAGGTRVFGYDAEGNKILESSWFDAATPRHDATFEYDRAGRLVRRLEPLDRETTYVYDGVGNVIRETLADVDDPSFAPRVTEYSYDELNRAIEVRHRLGSDWATSRVKYDGEGNKVLEIDPLGRETRHRYDALNRLLESVGPEWAPGLPHTTQYVYDGNDNLVQATLLNDPVDQVRTRTYDALNRLVRETDALDNTRSFEYDAVGNLVKEIDARLNTRSYAYDARNRQVRSTVHLTRVSQPSRTVTTTYAYDKVGNLTAEHWPNGNVVVHTYDDLNRLTATVDSLGPVTTSTYDARSNVVEATDGNGNVTINAYDAVDRLIAQELPEDRTLTFAYDVAGNKISETDARGHSTTYGYDTLNRLVEVTDPEPFLYTQSYTYDAVGNQLTETDRRGNTTSFEYDALDRLVRQIDPPPQPSDDPLEVSYSYDAAGNRLTELDRRGILSEFTYDAENRRTRVVRAGLEIEELGYDGNGNVVSRRDANGNVTTYEYDERDLLLAENRPLAAISRYTLDDMGDRVAARDPEGRITAWSYDLRRRMATETRAATSAAPETTTFAYDGNGNRTSRQRPEGGEWTYGYDGADRLVAVTDPEEKRTVYAYDKNGNLLTQTDANTNPTAFAYDELDRRIRKTYADGAFEETEYDPNGNVTERQDPKGQLTTFAHDALNRQVLATYPEDPGATDDLETIARVYDANNNVVEVRETYAQSGDQVTTRTYDVFDCLETVTERWSNQLRYAYDANGNRTQLTDPAGKVTTYSYDALNRMSSVVTAAGITEYTYYRDSRLKGIAYPNGTTAAYTYDHSGRVQTMDNRHTGALVSSFEYTYDRNGNRVEQTETHSGQASETTTYHYDAADRLVEVAYPEKTTTYTYDAVGNRLTEAERDTSDAKITDKSYTYNQRDQLEELVDLLDPSHSVTYTYDANGNQISRAQNTGVVTNYTFDVLDRLIRVEQGGLPIGTYQYNSDGLRIQKLTAEGAARYVYDDQSVLTRTDADGTTKYDYGPDRLLSLDDPVEGRAFYLLDALGSVVNLTTSAASLLGRYKYDAWGNYRDALSTGANPFGYAGHELDDETGLIYAKARVYDPEIGRFLTQDPVAGNLSNPPSLHKYLYAFQNPTVFVDPSGLQPEHADVDKNGVPDFLQAFVTDPETGKRHYVPTGSRRQQRQEEKSEQTDDRNFLAKARDFFFGENRKSGKKFDESIRREEGKKKNTTALLAAIEDNDDPVVFMEEVNKDPERVKGALMVVEDAKELGMNAVVEGAEAYATVVGGGAGLGRLGKASQGRKASPFLGGMMAEAKKFGRWISEFSGKLFERGKALSRRNKKVSRGIPESANFAQKTFGEAFSASGRFAGRTVDDVARTLRSGKLTPADVPIDFIVRDGKVLILNTRSSQALTRAGISRSQWTAVNRTGEAAFEARLTKQLQRNRLASTGSPTVRPSGGGG